MRQSVCPVCRRDVLADFPGLRVVCPQCEDKVELLVPVKPVKEKEEL